MPARRAYPTRMRGRPPPARSRRLARFPAGDQCPQRGLVHGARHGAGGDVALRGGATSSDIVHVDTLPVADDDRPATAGPRLAAFG